MAQRIQPIDLTMMYINDFLKEIRDIKPIKWMVNQNLQSNTFSWHEEIEELWMLNYEEVKHYSEPISTFMIQSACNVATIIPVAPSMMRFARQSNIEEVKRVFYEKVRYIIENSLLAYDSLEEHYRQTDEEAAEWEAAITLVEMDWHSFEDLVENDQLFQLSDLDQDEHEDHHDHYNNY